MKRGKKFLLLNFLLFLGGMVAPRCLSAQVILNELHPFPSTGPDWIELFHSGGAEVDLTGWSLWDAASQLNVTPDMDEVIVAAGEHLVFEVGTRLNNGGDTVILKNQHGEIVDQVSYTNAASNMSWARTPDGGEEWSQQVSSRGTVNALPSPSPTPTASPTPSPSSSPSSSPGPSPLPTPSPSPSPSSPPSPTPVVFPSEVRWSEIQACPETGEEEWIEIYNPSNENYTFTNWKVRDAAGNSRTINTSFPASTFTVLTWSGSLLNNDGDTILLERSDGQRVIEQTLPSCTRGETFIVINGTITTTTSSTKGSANISSGQVISPVTNQPVSFIATASARTSASPTTSSTQANTPVPVLSSATTKPSPSFQLPYLATALQLAREFDASSSTTGFDQPTVPLPINPRIFQLAASLCSLGTAVSGGAALSLWQWYTGFRDRYLEATL